MASVKTETARVVLLGSISLIAQTVTYDLYNGGTAFYNTHTFEGLGEGVEALSNLALLLKNIPEEGALELSADDLEALLKDWARDISEDAELPFTYTDGSGRNQTYTPASLWEASGSCSEWEQSAQEGYDYGWNV
jgi:hypothetical protein